jgi:predicted DNA-binding protein
MAQGKRPGLARIIFDMPEELYRQISEAAADDGRSKGGYVRRILEIHMRAKRASEQTDKAA